MDKKNQTKYYGMKPAGMSKKKKVLLIVITSVFVVMLAAVLAIAVFRATHKKSQTAKNVDKNVSEDWADRIADLENEPASDMDVVYTDPEKTKQKPYLIQVNKSQNCIIIYEKDSNGKYTKPYRAMICSVGYDTPTGEFTTSDKYEWKIVNGNVWAQYATRVVGNVLFHSMPYAANSKDTLITRYYNQLGSTFSASCIRMSARDAEWIMKNCPSGTKVQIYESDGEEPINRPKSILVPEDAVWDPTDPDPANPYQSVQIAFSGIESEKLVERGTQINYLAGIAIQDTCGNDLSSEVKVTGTVDTFTLGTYEVTYDVEDAAGKTANAKVTYQVVDTAVPEFSGLKSTINFSSVADVTKENILKDVYVIDNNELLDNGRIEVTIPTIVEGNNIITLTVTDDYGNVGSATVTAAVHIKPPVISLKPGSEVIIPLTQRVDQEYALSRVTATDNGAVMPADQITVEIRPTAWGYAFRYVATDVNGYTGVLNDSVSYVEYNITPPQNLVVTNINDRSQLLNGAQLNNTLGGSLEVSSIQTQVRQIDGNQYQVTYSYTYTSPLGSKTATATATATLQGNEPTPAPAEQPTSQPTETPALTENPAESQAPAASEPVDNTQQESEQ